MLKLADVIPKVKALVPPKALRPMPIAAADWEAAVGTRIAKRAEPVRLHKGLLQVRVASSAWANELNLLATDILTQLRERGIAVDALRFNVGPITTPQQRREPPRPAAPRHAALPGKLKPCMDQVEDDDLRAAMTEAAAMTLSIPRPKTGGE